jgi:ABC-2 type transport system ATP-binding protein
VSAVIRVVDVSKRFSLNRENSLKERLVLRRVSRSEAREFTALENISFDLEAGHTLGLIGANGSGKSTLLKLIGGILTPNTGYVERRGRLAALLELGAGFHPDLTGRENVYLNASILGLTRRQIDAYFDQIVDFSGIEDFIDTQVKFYSSGMYVRLAFAVAVHVDPEILLVDEVLAVGDEPFQRKCLDRIKQFQREGRTIVFVTHGIDVTRQLCDRVILLDHGKVIVDGTPLEALRSFRDATAPDSGPGEEAGSREIEIVAVEVAGTDGQPRETFIPGDDLVIDVHLRARHPVAKWACGMAIFNETDTLIYGTNSDLIGMTLHPITDEARLRFSFREIPMVEGRFQVTVAVHPPDSEKEYHRVERAARFRVRSDAGEVGVLHLVSELAELPVGAQRLTSA